MEEYRAAFGDWCPVCGRETDDLTADHIVPFALTGSEDSPLQVMCRSCNSRKGAGGAKKVR